jgi:hypothetical protein
MRQRDAAQVLEAGVEAVGEAWWRILLRASAMMKKSDLI